jgi:hypothetical protein
MKFKLLLSTFLLTGGFLCIHSFAQQRFPEFAALPEQRELPDPLKMLNGKMVATKEQWNRQRRPELKALFQHYMYGYLPPAPKIRASISRTYTDFFDGTATLKEVIIDLGKAGAPKIHVALFLPNNAKQPVPIILGTNFCGNHTLTTDKRVSLNSNWLPTSPFCPGVLDNRATDAARGKGIDSNWDIAGAIRRGYAIAAFYNGDVAPDTPDFTRGVFPHFNAPQTTKETAWGAEAAWAWGFHRVVDYLVTNKAIDKKRIAIFGHSRNGKAVLFAAAMDERIAMVFPHQAGIGGSAPSRGTVGESVKAINDRFPHWFNDLYPQFNDNPARLPFDQNALVALMAPRYVLFTCTVGDAWFNPDGQFAVLRGAAGVYRLLGVDGFDVAQMPKPGRLVGGRLGFIALPGKHSTTRQDWKALMDFADKHWKRN